MKIVFCLRNFLPQHVAGTEVYVAALCESLQKAGSESIILKPGFGMTATREYMYKNIRVIEYPESHIADKAVIKGKKNPEGINFFESILIDEKPDIIHFHDITGSNGITIAHLSIAEKLNIPVFTTLHLAGYACKTGTLKYKNRVDCDGVIDIYKCSVCSLHDKGLGFGIPEILTGFGIVAEKINFPLNKFPGIVEAALSYPKYIRRHKEILEKIFSISKKVFVLSHWFQQILVANSMSEEKMILLDKALPHALADPKKLNQNIGNKTAGLKLVYAGRICRIKGLHTILEALQNLENENWSLDIYGQVSEVEYERECKLLIKKISSKVFWKGILRPEEMLRILVHYDALIFPTIIEEMVGLVVMEAFAAKIPVIGSDVRGIAEQVKDGETGLLFKRGNANALAGILKKIIAEPTLLKTLSGNIFPPKQFDEVALVTLKAYSSVLQNNEGISVT